MQAGAAGVDWAADKLVPKLPDMMGPYNPVDVAADHLGDALNGGATCP